MNQPAADRYELVTRTPEGTPSWFDKMRARLANAMSRRGTGHDGGSIIASVIDSTTGAEVFRHIDDLGDEGGHLVGELRDDLASMTVDQFEQRWLR